MAYKKAPFFKDYSEFFEKMYTAQFEWLSEFTIQSTIEISHLLGIQQTRFLKSSEIPGITGEKTDRLIQILKSVGADHYISGPAAKDYIEEEKFLKAGIKLEYMQYNYPDYPQLYPPFESKVSIIDLLFNTGVEAIKFIISGSA